MNSFRKLLQEYKGKEKGRKKKRDTRQTKREKDKTTSKREFKERPGKKFLNGIL